MVALGVTVLDELAKEMAQVPLAKDHKVTETFRPDGPHKPFGVRVAVRAARRNRHALDAAGREHLHAHLGEQRIAVVDEVGCVAQETLDGIEQVSRDPRHPGATGRYSDARDVHGPGLQFDDEEDHDADRAEGTHGLDAK
jgi:hypothetical protein